MVDPGPWLDNFPTDPEEMDLDNPNHDTDHCNHIAQALVEDGPVIQKYKTVVSWNLYRYQSSKNSAKRRKVRRSVIFL